MKNSESEELDLNRKNRIRRELRDKIRQDLMENQAIDLVILILKLFRFRLQVTTETKRKPNKFALKDPKHYSELLDEVSQF